MSSLDMEGGRPAPTVSNLIQCFQTAKCGVHSEDDMGHVGAELAEQSLQTEMDISPANARQAPHPLIWLHQAGTRLPDGDVMSTLAVDGSRGLHAQPRRGRYWGVPFFVPWSAEAAEVVHAGLDKPTHGCVGTVPGVALPSNLRLISAGDLRLPVVNAAGDTEPVSCGQLLTLFTTTDSSTAAFEAAYHEFMTTCTPCHTEGHVTPPLDVDWDYLPADRRTLAAVLALDDLVASSEDPNTRLFATICTLHLRAMDMAFSDVLGVTPVAAMAAAALDAWTVTDPLLAAHALQARQLLSNELEFVFSAFKYKPYWDVLPLHFVGMFTDEVYEAEVRVCAPAFARDKALKAKVQDVASAMFAKLAALPEACQYVTESLVHDGVTFTVNCAWTDGHHVSSSSCIN